MEEEEKAATTVASRPRGNNERAAEDSSTSSSRSAVLGRLEDLQENMADFEYNLCSQFPHLAAQRDLTDKAKQLFKQMRLKEAQQKHAAAAESLFELWHTHTQPRTMCSDGGANRERRE